MSWGASFSFTVSFNPLEIVLDLVYENVFVVSKSDFLLLSEEPPLVLHLRSMFLIHGSIESPKDRSRESSEKVGLLNV